jgi:hypothetical protein
MLLYKTLDSRMIMKFELQNRYEEVMGLFQLLWRNCHNITKYLINLIHTLFSLHCDSSLTIKNSSLLLHDMFRSQRTIIRCLVR